MPETASPLGQRCRGDSLAIGVAAWLAYRLLGQHVLYGDGPLLLLAAVDGQLSHDTHFGYLPLLAAVHALLAPFGTSWHGAGLCLSQTSAALAIVVLHRASLWLGLDRAAAAAAAGLVACSPSVVFFATVVELHAPFLALAALACLALAALIGRPTLPRALALGGMTAAAFLGHAAGMLLPGLLLPMLWAWRWPATVAERRRLLVLSATATLVHAGLLVLLPAALRGLGFTVSAGKTFEILARFAVVLRAHPQRLLEVVHLEWLWPFLPLSVLWLAGLLRPGVPRRAAIALGLSLLAYLAASALALGVSVEHGAYLQPLAWSCALVTVLVSAGRQVLAVLLVTAALAVVQVRAHDEPRRARAYAEGFRAAFASQPCLLLIGDDRDLEACFVAMPEQRFEFLVSTSWLEREMPAYLVAAELRVLDARIDAALAEGCTVCLTAGAIRWLGPAARHGGVAEKLRHLRARYRLEPVQSGEFAGMRLHAPPR